MIAPGLEEAIVELLGKMKKNEHKFQIGDPRARKYTDTGSNPKGGSFEVVWHKAHRDARDWEFVLGESGASQGSSLDLSVEKGTGFGCSWVGRSNGGDN